MNTFAYQYMLSKLAWNLPDNYFSNAKGNPIKVIPKKKERIPPTKMESSEWDRCVSVVPQILNK